MAKIKHVRKNSPGLVFILLTLVVVAVVGARFFDPKTDGTEDEPLTPPAEPQSTVIEESVTPTAATPAGRVLVFQTHTSENYSPGETHSSKGRPGDIVAVGGYLASSLKESGYEVVHDTTVNDQPKYSEAYIRAKEVISSKLGNNQYLALVDIHRDAIPPGKPDGYTTQKIGGKAAAKILFVVGDVNNPYLEQNMAFANKLKTKMDEMYPGLARGVKVQHMDYNGGLHANSVLVYVGDYRYNTIEEAKAGAALLADVLAVVLDEIADSSSIAAPTTTP